MIIKLLVSILVEAFNDQSEQPDVGIVAGNFGHGPFYLTWTSILEN